MSTGSIVRKCIACESNPATVRFGCGHSCLCSACLGTLVSTQRSFEASKCPICRCSILLGEMENAKRVALQPAFYINSREQKLQQQHRRAAAAAAVTAAAAAVTASSSQTLPFLQPQEQTQLRAVEPPQHNQAHTYLLPPTLPLQGVPYTVQRRHERGAQQQQQQQQQQLQHPDRWSFTNHHANELYTDSDLQLAMDQILTHFDNQNVSVI
jgi:hypothetical protein